jgi:hypothetical protein
MFLSAVMVTVSALVSITMRLLDVASMISIFCAFSLSSKRIRCPLRDLMTRSAFLPSLLSAGAWSAVPQRADHEWKRIAALEQHQHFVLDFRQEIQAATITGHRRCHARPVTLGAR